MLKAFLFDFENESRRPFDPDNADLPDGCSQVLEMNEAKNVIVVHHDDGTEYYRRAIRLGASAFTYHKIEPLVFDFREDDEADIVRGGR